MYVRFNLFLSIYFYLLLISFLFYIDISVSGGYDNSEGSQQARTSSGYVFNSSNFNPRWGGTRHPARPQTVSSNVTPSQQTSVSQAALPEKALDSYDLNNMKISSMLSMLSKPIVLSTPASLHVEAAAEAAATPEENNSTLLIEASKSEDYSEEDMSDGDRGRSYHSSDSETDSSNDSSDENSYEVIYFIFTRQYVSY